MSKLLHGSVAGHLARLTLPSIGGMFAIMVFNLTDTWFLAKLGTDELAAMGFTFAVVLVAGSLAIGFSTGAASIISRAIGNGDRALARRTVSDGLVLTIPATLLVSFLGYTFLEPLFKALGAEGRILELVCEYMRVWFLGAVVAIMPPVCDGCLRASGDMVRPLLVMCTCAILNVILDPILIFGWGPVPAMGMKGAAIATIFSRSCGMLASLYFLHFHSRLIDWSLPRLGKLVASWKSILVLGIPAAFTQALNPIAQGFYMRLAMDTGGKEAVAAMTTGTRIENFVFIIAIAYGIAIVPFVGQNYGAQAFDRVRRTRHISNRLAFVYAAITLVVLLPSARLLSSLFSSEPNVVNMSSIYLIFATFGHAGFYLTSWTSQMLNVMGRPRPVLAINLSRVFILTIPLCLLGSWIGGFYGLIGGIAAGNGLSGLLAYLSARYHLRHDFQKR